MCAVHKALTGALEAAPAYVANADLDSERVEVIGSFCENVIEFLHVHHSGEDELIYPVLEQRCAESRPELERINDQHKLLHAPMDAGRSAIATWRAAPSTDHAQAVTDALVSIAEPLRPHLTEEETVLLPIASKWISPEEFGRLPGHHMMSFRADNPWLMMGLVWSNSTRSIVTACSQACPPRCERCGPSKWNRHSTPSSPKCAGRPTDRFRQADLIQIHRLTFRHGFQRRAGGG
jgi:hemerythrin-like domain-containing protein